MRFFSLLVLLLLQQGIIGNERLQGCPLSKLQIVTFNETLLPREAANIQAQIRYTGNNPFVPPSLINYGPNHTNVYCAPDIEELPQPFVTLVFTQPVVVVGIISGGYTWESDNLALDGLREYVSQFTLETSQTENETDYTLYNANQTEGVMEFVISDENVDRFILLKEPFMATRVRLQIIEKVQTRLLINITCWSLAFFGCLSSEATFESTDFLTTSSPVTSAAETVTSPEPVIVEGEMQSQAASTALIVSIVLPIALITVASVAVIVTVGVIICVKSGRNKTLSGGRVEDEREGRERAVTLNLVQNELYGVQLKESAEENMEDYEPIRHAHNPIEIPMSPLNDKELSSRDMDANYALVDSTVYSVPKCMTEDIPITRNASYGLGSHSRYVNHPLHQGNERESKVYENVPSESS